MVDERTRGAPVGEDELYCVQCGYNLRGLAGDPRCCPECGHANPLHVLLFPAKRIQAQLRRLESAPTACFAAVLTFVVGVLIVVLARRSAGISGPHVFGGLLICVGLVTWPIAAQAFARSCLHCPEWKRTLFQFHVHAAVIHAVGIVTVVGSCFLPMFSIMRRSLVPGGPPVVFIAIVLAWIVGIWLIRRHYRRARTELARLQRAVAVEMYLRDRH